MNQPTPPPRPLTEADRAVIKRNFRTSAAEAADLLLRWQLSQVRLAHGLSIDEVADRMGVRPDKVILEIESCNADPTLSTLRRYAMAIGVRLHREVVDGFPQPIAAE